MMISRCLKLINWHEFLTMYFFISSTSQMSPRSVSSRKRQRLDCSLSDKSKKLPVPSAVLSMFEEKQGMYVCMHVLVTFLSFYLSECVVHVL